MQQLIDALHLKILTDKLLAAQFLYSYATHLSEYGKSLAYRKSQQLDSSQRDAKLNMKASQLNEIIQCHLFYCRIFL